ncbi:hypothetical protein EYR40_000167 [Pleurotus pulmonarius]|nr:hypothetical protein EYR36_001474 [Pleurotus pulmonarius]KAF4607831.1 hypothetical protein EYR40_000167 [Pleurotus pulmonarius]
MRHPSSMKVIALIALIALHARLGGATHLNVLRQSGGNDGVYLAIGPRCGPLGGSFADVSAGVMLSNYKTIVAFGDSYTDGGKHDGSPLDPPVLIPPDVLAGGRSTNGLVWVEHLANDVGATIKDYAIAGACTDLSLWPSNPRKVDFLMEMDTFLGQNNNLDPDTTLYAIFFGINDFGDYNSDGNHMPQAAQVVLDQIRILSSPPTNGRSFLVVDVYGLQVHSTDGELWKQQIFDGLSQFHANSGLNVAFIDFSRIWDAVLNPQVPPGFRAFGFTSTDPCCAVSQCTVSGECADPDHAFYWLVNHPSKETHRIMADYVEQVLDNCAV